MDRSRKHTSRLSTKLRRAPTQYRPLERLAAGGMAEVFRAEAVFETGDTALVAIKRVLPELSSQPVYRSMFEDEARLGMLLRHPNIVRVYDARDAGGTYIMIMELVDGTSLKDMLDAAHARSACMPVPTALHVTREIARGLAYAHLAADHTGQHLGIIHRDVSPHNVLLGRDGTVKLADFGLANAKVHQTIRSSELVGGKLGYLAPEVISTRPADQRIDLFAVGIVLWEMLAGRRLFQGESDPETVQNVVRKRIEPVSLYNRNVPARVDDIVRRALDRNPDKRYLSAQMLLDEVEEALADIDREVGPRDVSLLVGLHLASKRAKAQPVQGLAAVARELDAFVKAAADSEYDIGAAPLDPSDFGGMMPSGVRPRPSDAPPDDDDWFGG
jgi:serine/threonine-protein kinase